MSDAWSTSRLYHRPSEPAYYIVDCRISRQANICDENTTAYQVQKQEKDSYQYFLFLSRNMNVLYNKVHISKVSYVNHWDFKSNSLGY